MEVVTDKTGEHIKAHVNETYRTGSNIAGESCFTEENLEPCTIVIIGASGDLTSRKLVPALFNLYLNKGLPDAFLIVGSSRTKLSSQEFKDKIQSALQKDRDLNFSDWQSFSASLFYKSINYDDLSSFIILAEYLKSLDKKFNIPANRIFYLAIPPSIYKTVAKMIGQAGLAEEGKNGNGWSRIVVEKPFGRDLESATDLDQSLHEDFKESQIFRIDHYLAKETVQNILMFRFANSIFEPIWNRRYIENINITAAESVGVEHRAGYYEQAGVLRDMFQNHMMQLLALTAMDPPSIFQAKPVRDEKIRVFRAVRPFSLSNLQDSLILGQYGPGVIDGKEVLGYREESGVSPDSVIPTFAMMKIFIDNWRWQGVPFYLMSGKRLARKMTQIAIQFKEVPHSVFRNVLGEHITANCLILGIYPEERITLTFQTKNPGTKVCLRSVTMDFFYHQNSRGQMFDAYEKVLIDCILGDQMLFWQQEGVELCWSFLTPILKECEDCSDSSKLLHLYGAGSWVPDIIGSS
ncbi:MAG: glucose-6-phosphate dehydrogenase [Desulfobacterales bacterium]|nr:glucose-6-phosphate dehydrogenase [Desulfobacterales bacterium]